MIRFAKNEELDNLKQLWQECFEVNFYSPYGAFYISNVFQKYKPLVYVYNDKFVSMLTLFPVKLLSNNRYLSGVYIWGVGTLKEYRNKSIASEMLNFVENYSKNLNIDFNILIPSNNSLYNFYFKRGFNINVSSKMVLFNKEEIIKFCDENSSILDFKFDMDSFVLNNMRRKNYLNNNFIEWDVNELEVIKKEYSLPDGNHHLLNFKDKQYAIIDFRDKSVLKIREFYILNSCIGSFIKTLLKIYPNYNFFEFLIPSNNHYFNFYNNYKLISKNIAMLKLVRDNLYIDDKKQFYFNFGLDT